MITLEQKNKSQAYGPNQTYYELAQPVTDGLDHILSILSEPMWPRTISTKTTMGRQIIIYSKQEALAWYKALTTWIAESMRIHIMRKSAGKESIL